MIEAKTLRLVTQSGLNAFAAGHILDGIAALHTLQHFCPQEHIVQAEAESLEENYRHMLSFLRNGGKDEQRTHVLEGIRKKGILLLEQASRAIRLDIGTDRYGKALERLRENYGPAPHPALMEKWQSLLTPEEMSETQDDLFDLIWTSHIWTPQDTARWYDFLLAQQDMVQQHLEGAVFLAAWEYFDSEKMQLLALLTESECHRTRLASTCHLLLLRLRHKELVPLMPDSIHSQRGNVLAAQVEYELLLMLRSEQDMKQEQEEMESLSRKYLASGNLLSIDSVKAIVELKSRFLKNRLTRGLDPNLAKTPLLHSCKYMQRIAHWFLPFDKSHQLFQSVMIDEKGNEKQHLSMLVDFILDCDVDKLATLYLVANDKDFSKAVQQLDEQEIPDLEHAVAPEYSFRFLMQDLFRFFVHSPLSTQLPNPFREEETLISLPQLAQQFPQKEYLQCCGLLTELGRDRQAILALDNLIAHKGASLEALQIKGQALMHQKSYAEALSCLRNAEMLDPDNEVTLRLLTECCAAQHRYDDQLEYLTRLAGLNKGDKALRRLIPMTMVKAGRNEEALNLFFQLDYEDNEEDVSILAAIAGTAFSLGKLDVAERYTGKELKAESGAKNRALLRAGHLKLLKGNTKKSLDYYERFIDTYCKETGKDTKAALALFDADTEMLASKGVATEDIQLLHDILQAATEASL